MNSLVSAKTALNHAINHLERLQNRLNSPDLMMEAAPSHATLALQVVLQSAIARGRQTCLVSESFSPNQAALRMMCLQAHVPMEATWQRKLETPEFTRLTWAAGRISAASVVFLSSLSPNEAVGHLVELDKARGLDEVVCERKTNADQADWERNLALFSKVAGITIYMIDRDPPGTEGSIPRFGQRA